MRCADSKSQIDRLKTTNFPYSCPAFDQDCSRENVALSGVADALNWRHALEMSQDPSYLRRGQRVVVHPKILDKLSTVSATGNAGLDPVDSRWRAYERIFSEIQTWPAANRPVTICEDDPEIGKLPSGARPSKCITILLASYPSLSGAAKHPAGAIPSKCIIIIRRRILGYSHCSYLRGALARGRGSWGRLRSRYRFSCRLDSGLYIHVSGCSGCSEMLVLPHATLRL
jgi:hypothetical protein